MKNSIVALSILGVTNLSHGSEYTPAGSLVSATSRTTGAVLEVLKEGDKIICVKGLEKFPETQVNISLHPINPGAYEITPSARKNKGVDSYITGGGDYLVIKDKAGKEIAKWSVQGNILKKTPLSVMQILNESQKC